MKQGSRKKGFFVQSVKYISVFAVGVFVSACSITSLKSFDTTETVASNEVSVFLETDCDDITFGDTKLSAAKKQLKQAITDYGFSVSNNEQADFLLNFSCRKESDLNFGILPNEISGIFMVASITMIPTYWPTDLWVDMEIFDLRGFEAEKVNAFASSYVSQERIVWAPFILFKLAYDFGLPKYTYDKFYKGLRSSAFSMLRKAESKSVFE